jgi:hypothetical protein
MSDFTSIIDTECTYPANIVPGMMGCLMRYPNAGPGDALVTKREARGPFIISKDPPGYFQRLINRGMAHE